MKTLDEFTKAGGKLAGSSHESHEEYGGAPRQYNDKLSTTFEKLGFSRPGPGATAGGIKSQHEPTDSGVSGVGEAFSPDSGHGGEDNGVAGAGLASGTGAATNRHRGG